MQGGTLISILFKIKIPRFCFQIHMPEVKICMYSSKNVEYFMFEHTKCLELAQILKFMLC